LTRAITTTPMATKTDAELMEKAALLALLPVVEDEEDEEDEEELLEDEPVAPEVDEPVAPVDEPVAPVDEPDAPVDDEPAVEDPAVEEPEAPVDDEPAVDEPEAPVDDPPVEVLRPEVAPVVPEPVVDRRPVVVVRRPVVEAVPVVLVAGQSDLSLMVDPEQELALRAPDPVPSRQVSSSGHQTQKGSRRQLEQVVYRSQSTFMQVSKNHSEQLRALPPGPMAFPARHSREVSHQPQPSVSRQVSQSVKRKQD